MNGEHGFNEGFFTGAHIDNDRISGEVGDGWSAAVTVLMDERSMTSLATAMPGRRAATSAPNARKSR